MKDPDLSPFLNKRLSLFLNNSREVVGVLKGFDAFMNATLEDAVDVSYKKSPVKLGSAVIRGVSIVSVVPKE